MEKRIMAIVCVIAMVISVSGCGKTGSNANNTQKEQKRQEKRAEQQMIEIEDCHLIPEKCVSVSIVDHPVEKNGTGFGTGLSFLMQEKEAPVTDSSFGSLLAFDASLCFEYPLSDVSSSFVIVEPVTDVEGCSSRVTFVYMTYKSDELPQKMRFVSEGTELTRFISDMFTDEEESEMEIAIDQMNFSDVGDCLPINERRLLAASSEACEKIFKNRAEALYLQGIENLKADGVIPETDEADGLFFDEETLEPVFLDAEAAKRLTSDWKPDRSGVVTADYNFFVNTEMAGFSASFEKWQYLIVYMDYVSRIEDDYYIGADRRSASTLVFVIDVSTDKIVHIRFIGADIPPASTKNPNGTVMKEEAEAYIQQLLTD